MTTKKAESKEVDIKKESAGALATVPDFMKQDVGLGVEALGAGDIEVPRLIVLQSLSPEVVDGDEKPGSFFHTILEENLGKELRMVVVYADIKYILWKPRHEGGGILARADDGKHWTPPNANFEVKPYKDRPDVVTWSTKHTVAESGLDKFGSSDPRDPNSQPAATKMWNFVVVLPDYPEMGPMVLTLQRGMADVGRNFSGKLKMSNLPTFGQVFLASVRKENKGSGDFFSLSFNRNKILGSDDMAEYEYYKSLYSQFSSMGLNIKDIDSMQEGESQKSSTETPEGAIEVG